MSKPDDNGVWITTDMSLAAWMKAKGKAIVAIHKVRRNEFRFSFRDEEHECGSLALEFLNSDAHLFDTAARALKKMCFGPGGVKDAVMKNQ